MNRAITVLAVLVAATAVASQPNSPKEVGVPTREVSREEVHQASLILADVSDQMRIAQAKLDKTALERNRQMGRLNAYEEAAADEIQLQAAETQRRVERHQQIGEQLSDLAQLRKSRGIDDSRLKDLIARSEADVDAAKERLDRISRLRADWQQKLVQLKAEHVTHLLEASMRPAASEEDSVSILERLMNAELQKQGN